MVYTKNVVHFGETNWPYLCGTERDRDRHRRDGSRNLVQGGESQWKDNITSSGSEIIQFNEKLGIIK